MIPTTKARLIVLSGEAGAGKDAVAKILVDQHGWELYSLASPLKRFAEDMFGFTHEQLYGPSSMRNAPDQRWARPCPCCDGTGSDCRFPIRGCEACEGDGKINDNSPRRILQLCGEEFLRRMIHVDALTMRAEPELRQMLGNYKKIVVNDGRNDNDRNNLHAWLGGQRIDVRAAGKVKKDDAAWRHHVSELRIASVDQLEGVIINDERWPFPGLSVKVTTMLTNLYG